MSITYRPYSTDCSWKQQTCCACGCIFRSAIEPVGKNQHGIPTAAVLEASDLSAKGYRYRVGRHPCPTCGAFQPDVVAPGKRLWHGLLTVLSLAPLMFLIGLGTGGTAEWALGTDLCALIAAGIAGGFALLHLVVALNNPNGNLAANLQQAEKAIAEHKLETVQPGLVAQPPRVPANISVLHGLALLSLLAAGPAFLAAVYLRSSNGWPNNAELRPELVGPGDEVRVSIPARHVQALGSAWHGEATARVLNAAEVGCAPTLKALAVKDSWRNLLKFKKEETETPIHPSVLLTMPDDPGLGGKTLRVAIKLHITYRSRSADKASTGEKTTVRRDLTIHLTTPESHETYWQAWQMGAGVGFFCCIGGGLTLTGLVSRLKRRGLPSTVVPGRA